MLFARTEIELQHVNVFLNILAIHMLPAGQNVLSIQIVHLTKHAREINALIPVLAPVVLMLCAE
jgi:hypothetical protein